MPVDHSKLPPFVKLFDAIAGLEGLAPQERAILWTLARHGDWIAGDRAYPSEATIGRSTGLSPRQVRRYLASLRCEGYGDPDYCSNRRDPKCRHRSLIMVVEPASRYTPTTYALDLSEWQPHLPEHSAWVRQGGHVGHFRADTEGDRERTLGA